MLYFCLFDECLCHQTSWHALERTFFAIGIRLCDHSGCLYIDCHCADNNLPNYQAFSKDEEEAVLIQNLIVREESRI